MVLKCSGSQYPIFVKIYDNGALGVSWVMSLDLRAIIHPLLLPDRWLESGGNMYNSDYDVDNHYWYDRKHFYPKNIINEMDKTKNIEMKLKIENRWLGWEQSHRQSLRNVKCDI